ncbi:hypothetical protein IAU60_000001 [Kwoniella sp. DSM 27419]
MSLDDKTLPVNGVNEVPFGTTVRDAEAGLREDDVANRNLLYRKLGKLFDNGVEARGIERVPEDERDGTHTIGLLLFWWSVNMVVSTVPIGSAVAAIVTFTALGSAFTSFIATLGPKTGLRTMVITRYSAGYVGATIFAFLNILTQLGFSVTAVILGGQTLTNVSNDKLPLQAAIVIVGVLALVLCFVGYDGEFHGVDTLTPAMHYWERYAWILLFVFYCCMWGLAGHRGFKMGDQQALQATGKEYAGDFLSFGPWKVFMLTWFGLMVPLVFVETLSAALMTVPDFAAAFEAGDAGGVLAEVFAPWGGGGKTLLPVFQKVPRALWTVLVFLIYSECGQTTPLTPAIAAIAGREHFSAILSNFLAILGYWIAFFVVVVFEEHYIFRYWFHKRGEASSGPARGYDLNVYDDVRQLPIGAAAIFACCCGAAAAVVSMAQTCAAITAVIYPPLRYIEYRYFER